LRLAGVIVEKTIKLIEKIGEKEGSGIFILNTRNGNKVIAKNIMSVVELNAYCGDKLIVFANDHRYDNAVDELAAYIERMNDENFREMLEGV
jgi:phosphotransferase system HPr-like phosphotransfer protein